MAALGLATATRWIGPLDLPMILFSYAVFIGLNLFGARLGISGLQSGGGKALTALGLGLNLPSVVGLIVLMSMLALAVQ